MTRQCSPTRRSCSESPSRLEHQAKRERFREALRSGRLAATYYSPRVRSSPVGDRRRLRATTTW